MPDSAAIAMSDAQPKAGPALSAVSDAPVIDITAKTVEDDAPAAAVEPEIKTAEELAAEAAAGKEPKEDKTDPAMKAAITKERNRARKAEEASAAKDERIAQMAAALEALTKKPEPEAPADRPRRDQFNDPDAYEAALEAYVEDRASKRAVETERNRQRTEQVQRQASELVETYKERLEVFTADHDDFDEVFNDDLPVTMSMTSAIMNVENGPELAYWLGKNPEEAKRISKLSDVGAVFELGRIAAKLSEPVETKVKAKPAPIKPVGQRSGSTDSGEEPSMEAYAAKRQSELRGGTTAH